MIPGLVAQSVEQRTENPCVGGSIPPQATKLHLQHCVLSRTFKGRHFKKMRLFFAPGTSVFRPTRLTPVRRLVTRDSVTTSAYFACKLNKFAWCGPRRDRLHLVAWAAGEWGDPLTRAANLVGLEISRGLARAKGALDYAVVSDANGTLDAAKMAAFRARIRTTRGKLPLFDRAPEIESLRASCLAETGLPPPIAPKWQNANAAR